MKYNNITHTPGTCWVKKRKTGQIDQYLCFFGIPRNASTSIRATLNLEKNFVKDFKEYIKEKKKRQDEFFKFTVIREPISRFVSGFLELIKYKKLLQFSYFVDDNPIELKFVEFLDLVESGDIMDDHINHQTYFLNYKVDIDFIICYELIVREWKILNQKWGTQKDLIHAHTRSNINKKEKIFNYIVTKQHILDRIVDFYKEDAKMYDKIRKEKDKLYGLE